VIVFVGGLTAALEGEEGPFAADGFAFGDRTRIELPSVQSDLLEELKALGPPVVFVLCAGGAVAFNKTGIAAVIDAFYPGEAGGRAVADAIVGDFSPAGRLPVTFYASTGELPDMSDYDMTADRGRTYRYYRGQPLYPFGHGMSYTTFAYADLGAVGNPVRNETVTVSFRVRNTGARSGDEVMQVYVAADRPREPIKALKWFRRQSLPPANVGTRIEALLPPQAFETFNDEKGELEVIGGRFRISVGGSSADEALLSIDVVFDLPNEPEMSLSTIAIVGIVAGALSAVAVATLGVWCCRRNRARAVKATPLLRNEKM
jgi:beta-glucosidase